MQKPFRLFLLFVLAIGTFVSAGCASPEDSAGKNVESVANSAGSDEREPGTYRLRLEIADVAASLLITLNGFPVFEQEAQGRAGSNEIKVMLNTALVGEGNRLAVEAEPRLIRSGEQLQVGPTILRGQVLGAYERPVGGATFDLTEGRAAWEDSLRAAWQGYFEWEQAYRAERPQADTAWSVAEGGALDSARAWAARHPLTASVRFDNERGPDFSQVFEEAPVIEDTSRLVDYAIKLRDVFREENAEVICREHQIKFGSVDCSREDVMEKIQEGWLSYDWQTDFERSDLALEKWSDGRVWKIYRTDSAAQKSGKQALLFAMDGDFLATWHEVYVAEVDGELQVVR